jgi:protein-disulfide isomerase
MSKTLIFIILLAAFAYPAPAQTGDLLATSSLRAFTSADLSPDVSSAWASRDKRYAAARDQLFSQFVTETLLEAEAKSSNTTTAKLIDLQKSKVADPTENQIKAVYDANAAALGNKPLEQVRSEIVRFLRQDPESRLIKQYADELALKYKVGYQTDVNAANLKPTDVLFTIGGKPVTDQQFESRFKLSLYDAKADLADVVHDDIEDSVLNALISAESATLKIDEQMYIDQEINNKIKNPTDDQKRELVDQLRARLFAKYKVKILVEPPPIVQKISADDDPARGPANAPVMVIMFGDFQCPVCGKVYPILQQVIAEFPGRVRFVERDFPLEEIHQHAFRAALAAQAANLQGKFFEYSELLYKNQDALDDGSLKKYAAAVGLNVQKFEIDLNSEKTAAEVRKDMSDGDAYGVTGTPTIFVNGVSVRRLDAEAFRDAIRKALRSPANAPTRSVRRS